MGAATAWQLARQGHEVTLIEAYEIGHKSGSSHGSSRIYRRAYGDPLYVRLTGAARELWQELEHDTGTRLLRLTGGLDFGAGRDPGAIADILAAAAVPHELLTAAEATDRWPQFRFDGPVLHHPDAGTVDADATVAAAVRRVAELGARVLTGTRVTGAEILNDGRVALSSDGPTVVADTVVVASGAWLPQLAAPLGIPEPLPPLQVTQQQVFHFRRRDPSASWPVFVHKDELNLYGLPSGSDGGPLPAFKVAQHDEGTPQLRTPAPALSIRSRATRSPRGWNAPCRASTPHPSPRRAASTPPPPTRTSSSTAPARSSSSPRARATAPSSPRSSARWPPTSPWVAPSPTHASR